jgi:hypothetical protein
MIRSRLMRCASYSVEEEIMQPAFIEPVMRSSVYFSLWHRITATVSVDLAGKPQMKSPGKAVVGC